jgi:hypothetical protein
MIKETIHSREPSLPMRARKRADTEGKRKHVSVYMKGGEGGVLEQEEWGATCNKQSPTPSLPLPFRCGPSTGDGGLTTQVHMTHCLPMPHTIALLLPVLSKALTCG